jgi:tetratricopeptide (TPR) repeat protein
MPGGRRYRAFISYSHRDRAIGDKLFRKLDGYRLPRSLRGQSTTRGPLPEKLYPIFRDREELAASAELPSRLQAALNASDHLVVLCSPAAVKSRWVNKEVETFQGLGRADQIIAVLADGEPAQAFPPALTRDGSEPVAADLRPSGDGWSDGVLKVIAALLGINFGELKNREVARARARARVYATIAGLFAILMVIAIVSAWRAVEQTRRAEAELSRAEAAIVTAVEGVGRIVNDVGSGSLRGTVPAPVARSLLATAEGIVNGIVALAPDNPSLKLAHGSVLTLLHNHYLAIGDLEAAREAAVRAGAIAAGIDAGPDYQAAAVAMRVGSLFGWGDALAKAGGRAGALAAYEEGLRLLNGLSLDSLPPTELTKDCALRPFLRAAALARIGDLRRESGDHAGARNAYEEALAVAWEEAERSPGNSRCEMLVAAVLMPLADLDAANGNRAGALQRYEEVLALARRLAAADPANAEWSEHLFSGLIKVGTLLTKQEAHTEALQAFRESLAVARRLADADPDNTERARDVSIAYQRIGEVRFASADWAEALAAYEQVLTTARRLTAKDRSNAIWARDLSVALSHVGKARAALGDRSGALRAYEESLAIRQRLAASDPGNAVAAVDLAFMLYRLAAAVDDAAAARTHYQAAQTIASRLAAEGHLSAADSATFEELKAGVPAAARR